LHTSNQRVFSHFIFAVQTKQLPTSPQRACSCFVVTEWNPSSSGTES